VIQKDTAKRLGRGLASLIGDAPIAAAATGVPRLAVDLLEPSPFQPRKTIHAEALNELADSIRAQGMLQPLLVRTHPAAPGRYQIIAGERRWRAAQMANLHEVPVHLVNITDRDAIAAALVENLQRADLNAVEEAEGYQRLMNDHGMTQEALAQAVGKSRSHVANMLRLLNLPPIVLTELRNGAISAGHARALLAHPDPEAGSRMVIATGMSVRDAEAMVQRTHLDPRGDTQTVIKAPEIAALEQELSTRLGLKVELVFKGQRGVVKIHCGSLDQLDSVIAQLSRN
jgi:ParB family chromosome partitioning protein